MKSSMKRKHITKWLALAALMLAPAISFAQDAAQSIRFTESDFGIFKWIAGLLVIVVVMLAWITMLLSVKDPARFSVGTFFQSITGSNAADPQMDHKYDEIVELDNPVPLWLKLFFYGCILFAVVYIFHYHVLGTGALQIEEYNSEVAEAAVKYKDSELPPDKVTLLTDGASLGKAKAIFVETCAPCHREDAGGTANAPNLTDDYWQNGNGTVADIYSTITNGVPAKGMISWKSQIPSRDRQALASFILSLKGSNPKDAMPPYGKLLGEGAPATAPVDSAAVAPGDTAAKDSASVAAGH
jgi:cytochrome c oxidase cbb3-type subunit 3